MTMPFWSNLRTCGVYFVYLFIFFWMLIKEFLGYRVDWSRRPFTRTRPSHNVNSHKGVRERNKDLEANLGAPANTVFLDGSKKMTSDEKQNGLCDSDYFVIYEAHPVHTKKAACTSGADCELTSQVLPTPLVSPEHEPATQDRTRDSLCAHLNTPAIFQSSEKDVSHIDPKPKDFIAEAVEDSLHEQQQLEDAATSRLNFVQGLKYKENSNFKFPAILSALRAKSIKPRRELKKGMLPQTTTILSARPSPKLKASSISTVTSAISKQTTLALDSSCHFPSLSLPPVQTSTSSVSSYSSTYTIVETSLPDLPTPTDEDIPISFNRSFPSWRRDPDRAKLVFGSLARSIIAVTSDGKSQSGITNNGQGQLSSIEKPKVESERTHEAAISEKCSTLKDQRLESIMIAMGLNPLPSASTLHSDMGISEDKDKRLGRMQLSKGHEITRTGSTALMDTIKNRESVKNDLLSWVQSSSSISSQ